MSEASIAARAAMKAKAHRLVQHNNGKVDATSGDLPKAFDATPKTGQRPTTKAYASGGKVHGEEARKRADKMPRKKRDDGGKTDAAEDNATTSADYRKRLEAAQSGKTDAAEDNATTSADYRKRLEAAQSGKSEEASERKAGGRTGKMGGGPIDPRAAAAAQMAMASQRSGVPSSMMNFGGVKKGLLSPARIVGQKGGKMKHDDEAEDKKLIKSMVKKEDLKGRVERKHGGRTGKTAVNIVIATGHKPDGMGGPGAPGMPPHPIPPQMAPPSMPPGAGPAMMPPQGPPGMPPGMPPMGRKRGGRTTYPIDTGAGGGQARLDKIKSYGATQK